MTDTAESPAPEPISPTLQSALGNVERLRAEVGKVIFGQERVIEQMIIALLCGGHALLEGTPGTAKTLAVRALALALSCRANRIQFTPDLMPSDIVGTNVFNMQTNAFELRRGPVFTDLLLGDEINRAPAKTQSALLEGMSESHATIDGVRYELSPVFTVFATQNPVEFEGTYPLPEAQLDRFLLKIIIDYPTEETERRILEAFDRGEPPDRLETSGVEAVLTRDDLLELRAALPAVRIEERVMGYALEIVRATRDHDSILLGAGPRGSIYLLATSKAQAMLQGRDFVTPDDVDAMAEATLAHRVSLTADAEIQGATARDVLQSLVDGIDVPR